VHVKKERSVVNMVLYSWFGDNKCTNFQLLIRHHCPHVLCPPLHCPKTISLSCCNRHMKHCSIRFHMSPSSRYDVVFFFGLDKQYKILNYYYHYEYLSNFRMCQQALLTSTLCIHSISPLPVPTAHQPSKRSLSRPSKSKSGW
jgi:hypothetical protein